MGDLIGDQKGTKTKNIVVEQHHKLDEMNLEKLLLRATGNRTPSATNPRRLQNG